MMHSGAPANRYALVRAASRRARHLYAGAPALGLSASKKPCRIAQDEVCADAASITSAMWRRVLKKH